MHRRVMVTGAGVVGPLGLGCDAFYDGLVGGRSGVGAITAFDPSALRVKIAGEARAFDPAAHFDPKQRKRLARFTQLALVAARQALASAEVGEEGREDIAVVVGSGIGGFDTLEREHASFLARGPGRFAPLTAPAIIANMAAGWIATDTGCRGPNLCLATACATGAHSLGTALDLLRSGRADAALAGATESTISPFAVDGYCQLHALSTRNDDPERASRPFDAGRDGFVMAEGAAVLFLETEERARRRGVRPLAELAGYGATADGYHPTAPDPTGQGAARAIRAALDDARLDASAVELVNAHGTSTPQGDIAETRALKVAFGEHASRLWVQATKSMTGHTLGAAGAVEAAAVALQIARGAVHGTLNLENPDPECDLDYVRGPARERRVEVAISNSFAFGGHNAVLVFRRAA